MPSGAGVVANHQTLSKRSRHDPGLVHQLKVVQAEVARPLPFSAVRHVAKRARMQHAGMLCHVMLQATDDGGTNRNLETMPFRVSAISGSNSIK